MSVIKVNTIQNANGTTGITFAANGQMTLANTPLQLTGGQIVFPATQIASADGNTLDDYEEGSWTPNVGGNATYITQVGRYTKIGNLVYIEFYIAINVLGTGSNAQIFGLPFVSTSASSLAGLSISFFQSLSTSVVFIGGYKNTSDASIIMIGTTAAAQTSTNAPVLLQNNSQLYASMTYRSAS
jgi:hypothetical protein